MKKLIILSLLILIPNSVLGGDTSSLSWDATEKTILSSIVAANAVDCWQTHILTVRRSDEYMEVNGYTRALFGDRVAWYKSAAMKTAVFGPLIYFGCHKWAGNRRVRKLMLTCLLAVSIEPVIRNEDIGGKVVFNF